MQRNLDGCLIDLFSKCTRMAIMPILAAEALLHENKKSSEKCYPQWE